MTENRAPSIEEMEANARAIGGMLAELQGHITDEIKGEQV